MTRVLLFADFGKGPRYVCRMTRGGTIAMARASDTWFTWGANTKDPRPTARRWWLVECESAEAGRAIIAEDGGRRVCGCRHIAEVHRVGAVVGCSSEPFGYTVRLGAGLATGRILDSG